MTVVFIKLLISVSSNWVCSCKSSSLGNQAQVCYISDHCIESRTDDPRCNL